VPSHAGRLLGALVKHTRGQHDADRLLHGLKDPRRHLRLMALGRTVDNPNVMARASQVVAHFLEAGTIEKSSNADETYDPGLIGFF
jgi:hypothetical protein